MELIFWFSGIILCYTYLGYPILLGILVNLKKYAQPILYDEEELPPLTLIIACYNEASILEQKIKNCLELIYPDDKKRIIFVTDGSNDDSKKILEKYNRIEHFHKPERKGKNAAVNRVMTQVTSPIVVFCDANTRLNNEALINIAKHYKDPKVGAVAGEKRVVDPRNANAASMGEGAYWKYESRLKKWDSNLLTVVGAAGELFSVRSKLYEPVDKDVIIEDFRLSMTIAKKGYRVIYEPDSYAIETGSASVEEENKRKIRISAGGLKEVWHFRSLLNIFKYGTLSFQYISHRMLRWTLAPLSLLLIFVSNLYLVFNNSLVYQFTFIVQCIFYLLALFGHLERSKSSRSKAFLLPYYFVFMNLSVFRGFIRLIKGGQSVVWEKARRAEGF